MRASNLTRDEISFYVVGTVKRSVKTCVTLKLVKCVGGWRQRVLLGNAPGLNCDYVKDETRDELNVWFGCDFDAPYLLFTKLEEALEYHARCLEKVAVSVA